VAITFRPSRIPRGFKCGLFSASSNAWDAFAPLPQAEQLGDIVRIGPILSDLLILVRRIEREHAVRHPGQPLNGFIDLLAARWHPEHQPKDAASDAAGAQRVKWKEEMPEVTRFFGIVVRMYFRDHSPAHFHAEYGEYEALVEIETLSTLRGDLPRRAMALVLEWAALHRQELRADWERARGGEPLESIAPLD